MHMPRFLKFALGTRYSIYYLLQRPRQRTSVKKETILQNVFSLCYTCFRYFDFIVSSFPLIYIFPFLYIPFIPLKRK